jgi:hypothetical protein
MESSSLYNKFLHLRKERQIMKRKATFSASMAGILLLSLLARQAFPQGPTESWVARYNDTAPWKDQAAQEDGDGQGDVCDEDDDGDGVADLEDLCDRTALGAEVDVDGCSGQQLVELACPCDADWKNHGECVSCVAHEAEEQLDAGLITLDEKGQIVSEHAKTGCGKKK